jgi:hypothetical protein
MMSKMWTPEAIPQELKDIIDRYAGKEHTTTGLVMQCLAEVLNKYDDLVDANLATIARDDIVRRLNFIESYVDNVYTPVVVEQHLEELYEKLGYEREDVKGPSPAFAEYNKTCMQVACRRCKAEVGKPCIVPGRDRLSNVAHKERAEDAAEAGLLK